MKRHIFTLGLAAIATTAALIAPATANAATLSQQATDLSKLDPTSSQYSTKYNSLLGTYNSQASSYSLAFEDWFAMNSFINNETAAYGSSGAKLGELVALDLNALTWEAGANNVEVFFVNEGAGYRNKFGYSTTDVSSTLPSAPVAPAAFTLVQPKRSDFPNKNAYNAAKEQYENAKNQYEDAMDQYEDAMDDYNAAMQDPLLGFWNNQVEVIWNDVASKNSILAEGDGALSVGQGHMIGNVAAGDTVNFFLRNPYNYVLDGLAIGNTLNGDNLQHVTTYQYGEFLVLAYEDIYGGGDFDYNDVVIAVRGLVDTEQPEPTKVPEPASLLGLLGVGLFGTVVSRKRASQA